MNRFLHFTLSLVMAMFTLTASASETMRIDELNAVAEATLTLKITKTSWATIGNQNGEAIGTATLTGSDFDHIEAEIRCEEDPDQYITFANLVTNGGELKCFSWEGGHYNLNNGYHYTLTVKGFDVPYYGAAPVATATYEFVGTGVAPTMYSPMQVVKIALWPCSSLFHGYYIYGNTFDVTFSEPASEVSAWWAKGFDGATKLSATQKSSDGTKWTIIMPEDIVNEEGSVNIMITAKDKDGVQMRGEDGDHAYSINISCNSEDDNNPHKPFPDDDDPDPVPDPTAAATLTISGTAHQLSETEAVELEALPAGAEFVYTCEQKDTKAVAFQIYDVTAESMLKSVAILYPTDGSVSTTMAIEYKLAKGHSYEAQFKEYNVAQGITTKQPTAEHNYKIDGTANTAVYSNVKIVSCTPAESEVITDANEVVNIEFSEAIASLEARAILGQMNATDIASDAISTTDNIHWAIQLNESYFSQGSLSIDIIAIDNEGNRVTDPNNGVGTPESCYVQYGWAATIGLPTPTLVEDGKTFESVKSLTFKYDGIGLNENDANSTWRNISIALDGATMNLAITADQFQVLGEDAGNALLWTLPGELTLSGEYTVTVPAFAFMLGHDIQNFYNGDATYTFTIEGKTPEPVEPTLTVDITKTEWATIGNDNGEVVATATLSGADFDHIEAYITCQEDPDQYITFAALYTNGGNVTCYTWEGGHYDLNNGYHYTLTIDAFDVPYYGVAPIATYTYDFVGTGVEAIKYSDITVAAISLEEEASLYHGYKIDGTSFDVTFSEPASQAEVWMAMGMDGAKKLDVAPKSEDGTVWTVTLPESVLADEGSINVMITAWDANGIQMKGENGDHAYSINILIQNTDPDAINAIAADDATAPAYNLAGQRVNASAKGIIIRNGKKVLVK